MFDCISKSMYFLLKVFAQDCCEKLHWDQKLSKDWKVISRCLKLIAKCSGVSLTRLQEFVISKHLSSCELFASKILSDAQHPLHPFLSNSRLSRPSRSSFRYIFARTNAYKNSVIPYLARFLTNKQNVRDELFSFIHSWIVLDFHYYFLYFFYYVFTFVKSYLCFLNSCQQLKIYLW